MDSDTKHNNVMVAIHMINESLSQLEKVAQEDGKRGEYAIHGCIHFIRSYTVSRYDEVMGLSDWLEGLEADLEPEAE